MTALPSSLEELHDGTAFPTKELHDDTAFLT